MLSMIVVNLALFFRWIGLGSETGNYRPAALGVVFIALLFQVPIFIYNPNEFVVLILVTGLLGLFKLYLTTGVGLHYAQALQIPYFRPGGLAPIVRSPIKQLLVVRREGWFLAVFGSLVFMLAITGLLFWSSDAKPSDLVLEAMPEHSPSLPLIAMTVLIIAFAEEIVFRLGLQNWLSYAWGHSTRSYWLAILVTTTIWTLGHAGMVEPAWVKFLQMFIMGVLLGVLNQRFGILACIAVHGLFNVIVTLHEGWFL